MRPDLGELRAGEQEIAELQLLLAHRRDLITDQSRTITPPERGTSVTVSGFGADFGS
jgi:hypothetical protein